MPKSIPNRKPGGHTTVRDNRRKIISNVTRPLLGTVRGPARKHAMGVMVAWTYRNVHLMETPALQRMCLRALTLRIACWGWCSTSASLPAKFFVVNNHASQPPMCFLYFDVKPLATHYYMAGKKRQDMPGTSGRCMLRIQTKVNAPVYVGHRKKG